MKIALIGNQNSGKTTLFNLLTGMNQKIGNWAGVTIERKEGIVRGTKHQIVDLPGIYSLSPYTSEEEISRNFILKDLPDLVINIIDATSIERSLYLTTQLKELDIPVLVALNMADIFEKKGIRLNVEKLSAELNCKVVSISALKKTGIEELIKAIDFAGESSTKKIYCEDIENAIAELEKSMVKTNSRFVAVKMLEGDFEFPQIEEQKKVIDALKNKFNGELLDEIASERYSYIEKVVKNSVEKIPVKTSVTDKLDKIFLNKWLAFPIFAVIMFLVYYLSVGVVGSATVDFIDGLVSSLKEVVSNWLPTVGASAWAVSLLVDGVIAGVGAVLNFVPQLIVLFLLISILETTGYMARIAFFLDRVFRRFGLSGKSLIPFIVGSGCSVPAIMAARTIEDEKERKMTIILTPFIPCSAKLPIIALFAGYFFPNSKGIVSFSMYFFAIVVILISAVIMKKFIFKGKDSPFITELPEYKLPSFRYVARDVGEKTLAFIKRAGTIILLCSIVIWTLGSFSFSFKYGVDISESILAKLGGIISPIFYPMLGVNSWEAAVSAIQGLVAKEQVVSSMEVIAGLAEGAGEGVFKSVFSFFTPISAYAFMVFNLFSAPCFGAIGAMKRELKSPKRTVLAVLFQTGLAWALASLVFGIGTLIKLII